MMVNQQTSCFVLLVALESQAVLVDSQPITQNKKKQLQKNSSAKYSYS